MRLFAWLPAALLPFLFFPGAAALADQPDPRTVVVLEQAELVSPAGDSLGAAKALAAYEFWGQRDGRIWIAFTPPGETKALPAGLPSDAATVLPGPAARHQKRLDRLKKVPLDQALARRLAAGEIRQGDSLWEVEYAWGLPDRSFMVNYFSDEQHYVYFRPGGERVLLRFEGGKLSHQPPE